MTLGRFASALMPLQLVANVDCEVVFVRVIVHQVFLLPVHYVWASQLPKVKVDAFRPDGLAVKTP